VLALASVVVAVGAQALQAWVGDLPIVWIPADVSAWIEVVGFVTGIVAVYLVVRNNLWTWPIGILNVLVYGYFFFVIARHFANAGLQVVFLIAQIHGWYAWTRRTTADKPVPIRAISLQAWVAVGVGIGVSTAALVPLLQEAGGNVPFFDALTTGISLAAQLLLNLKRVETWLLWIAADAIYVPLYIYRAYYPTAILYGVFFVLAVMGWVTWRRQMLADREARPAMPY